MRKMLITLFAGLGLCGLAAGVLADDESTIKYRQSIMKSVGGFAGALGAITKGDVPFKAHAPAHAQALKGLSMQVLDAFKDEALADDSRAKAEIWSDRAGFEKAAKKFQMAATDLAAAADGQGDLGAPVKALFQSCKGCHEDYRAKKD